MKVNLPFPKPSFQFPHFTRKINAVSWVFPLRTLTVILLVTIIILNLCHNLLFETNLEKELQQQIISNPANYLLHEKLGQTYLSINAEAAKKEYELAQELYQQNQLSNSNVLGLQSSPWQNWQNMISIQEKLKQEVALWRGINATFPDYRYALLKLAALKYQLGEKEESEKYLEILLRQNPKNETVLLLKQKIR